METENSFDILVPRLIYQIIYRAFSEVRYRFDNLEALN
jgi:hypothetical protein